MRKHHNYRLLKNVGIFNKVSNYLVEKCFIIRVYIICITYVPAIYIWHVTLFAQLVLFIYITDKEYTLLCGSIKIVVMHFGVGALWYFRDYKNKSVIRVHFFKVLVGYSDAACCNFQGPALVFWYWFEFQNHVLFKWWRHLLHTSKYTK